MTPPHYSRLESRAGDRGPGSGAGLAPGRYRVTNTLYIWPGVRIIGFGEKRPVYLSCPPTPRFWGGVARKGPVLFRRSGLGRSWRRAQSRRRRFRSDANPGTFYSALANIDVEIEEANPGADAVRARYAQHCFLAHIDIPSRAGPGRPSMKGAMSSRTSISLAEPTPFGPHTLRLAGNSRSLTVPLRASVKRPFSSTKPD